jgi:hypothetical protein
MDPLRMRADCCCRDLSYTNITGSMDALANMPRLTKLCDSSCVQVVKSKFIVLQA